MEEVRGGELLSYIGANDGLCELYTSAINQVLTTVQPKR